MTDPRIAVLSALSSPGWHPVPEAHGMPWVEAEELLAAYDASRAAAPSAPADRAALRDRIAAAIWERQNPGRRWADCEYRWRADAEADADTVLAVLPATANRAAILREAADEVARWYVDTEREQRMRDAIAHRLRRMGGEAQQPTPCSQPNPCEDGGDPCTTHEREQAHAEGDHGLCGAECTADRCTCDSEDHTHDGGCPLYEPDDEAQQPEICELPHLTIAEEDACEQHRLDGEAQQPETQAVDQPPVCEGFQWIGQSFATCERCGQPAWDHDGEEVAVEGAGPFDTRRTVRPWKPGQADAIRAKWAPTAAVSQPGKEATQ